MSTDTPTVESLTATISELKLQLGQHKNMLANAKADRDSRSKTIVQLEAQLKQSDACLAHASDEVQRLKQELAQLKVTDTGPVVKSLMEERKEMRLLLKIGEQDSLVEAVTKLQVKADILQSGDNERIQSRHLLIGIRQMLAGAGVSDRIRTAPHSSSITVTDRTTADMLQQFIYMHQQSVQHARAQMERADKAERDNLLFGQAHAAAFALLDKAGVSGPLVKITDAIERLITERDQARSKVPGLDSAFRQAPVVDWSSAPPWAACAAYAPQTGWRWYSQRPERGHELWCPTGGGSDLIHPDLIPTFSGKWEDSLVQRPGT